MRSMHVNVDGSTLEVRQIAKPDSKLAPLVFLHEGLGSVAMWRDWPEALCRTTGRSGWVYSRRGYGTSSPIPHIRVQSAVVNGVRTGRRTPDYMHDEAWVVLPELLQTLGVERPVLLGHSDGASIALVHASRFPATACVVMAPHVLVEPMTILAIEQARLEFENGDLRNRLARYHADVDCAFWQWNDIWLDPAFRKFDIRENCRQITAPILALQGIDDPYGSMRQIDDIHPAGLIERIPLDACGHSPHREQNEQTTDIIARFLSGMR